MKNGIQGLIAAAAMLPAIGAADALNYNYVEGGLAFYPSAGADQTWIGVDLRGSYAIDDRFFALGGFKFLTDDFDYMSLHVGGAYRHTIDQKTSLWGGVTIEHQSIDVPKVCFGSFGCAGGGSVSETGLGLRGGMRHQLNEKLEIGGSARLVTGDFDYLGLAGTARYKLQDNLTLLGEVDLFDGDIGVIGGVTFAF